MGKVKQATIADLSAILNLQKTAFKEVSKLMNRDDLPPLLQSIEELNDEYTHSVILIYVSEKNKIIGSVRGLLDDDICHIGKLIVHPNFQNQGIGKILMHEIETYFPSCKQFRLFTGDETPNTVYLYQKMGYNIIGQQEMGDISMILMNKINKII